jgi:hypothetical protein
MRVKIGLGILCFAGAAMAASAQSAQTTTPRAGDKMPPVDTSRSNAMPSSGAQAPTMASDCTNDAWRGYTSPKFKSEKACQSYVKKHMKKGSTGETNAPHPDMSSGTGANTGTHSGTGTTSGSASSSGAQPRPTPGS